MYVCLLFGRPLRCALCGVYTYLYRCLLLLFLLILLLLLVLLLLRLARWRLDVWCVSDVTCDTVTSERVGIRE